MSFVHSFIATEPYKLSGYAYSFIRRLRELASPLEAYNLQVADVDCKNRLKPLQELTVMRYYNYLYDYLLDVKFTLGSDGFYTVKSKNFPELLASIEFIDTY
uniref:Nicotinate phosphoribosyltransferase n=1 Tax=Panagrellus redivivus TaxID=6233 RepID=A0A7E4V5J8_PANRE